MNQTTAFALACTALLVAACGKPAQVVVPQDIPPAAITVPPATTPIVANGGGGGIYKIGEPYTVAGRTYTPRVQPGYRAEGLASWYGPNFHGKLTANGEIFDQYAVTAAHQTLPLPSKVRVTNLSNGRQLVVRVNDRGPFVGDRIIDLSRRSAQLLDIEKSGVAPVRLELVDSGPHLLPGPKPEAPLAHRSPEPAEIKTVMPAPRTDTVFVQLGAFRLPDNAYHFAKRITRFGTPSIQVSEDRRWHRVQLGPFASTLEADHLVEKLKRAGYVPRIVEQDR